MIAYRDLLRASAYASAHVSFLALAPALPILQRRRGADP